MSWTNRVVWQEGMFLRTQHFQQQDRWTEQLVRGRVQALRPHPWGADRTTRSTVTCWGPAASRSPPPPACSRTARRSRCPARPIIRRRSNCRRARATCWCIWRCRSARPGAVEVADSATEGRYAARPFEAYDTHSASPQPAELQVGRLRLRYLLETDERTGYLCIGLARVTEVTADRRIMLDERWIPPSLVCSAAPPLSGLIAELSGMLNQRGEALAARMTAPGQAGVAQVADFLLLQSINGWQNVLAHWADAANIHPEALYTDSRADGGRIRDLHRDAAAERLSGLSPRRSAAQFRARWSPICGARCRRCWRRRRSPIPLREARHGVRVGPITDRSILRASNFVLTVQADVQTEQLRRLFPSQVKIGAVEHIRELVNVALPGIAVRPLPVAPRQLPFYAGRHVFRAGSCQPALAADAELGRLRDPCLGGFPESAAGTLGDPRMQGVADERQSLLRTGRLRPDGDPPRAGRPACRASARSRRQRRRSASRRRSAPPPSADRGADTDQLRPQPADRGGGAAAATARPPAQHLQPARPRRSARARDPADPRLRAGGPRRRRAAGPAPPAHYALCASLDDVVLNTPWGSTGAWAARSLVSTFHEEVRGGEGFFDVLGQLRQNPGAFLPVLELMYLCLSLGFRGQYRLSPRGPGELDRLREDLYAIIARQRQAAEPGAVRRTGRAFRRRTGRRAPSCRPG